ncbi:hypothetical protein FN976_20520 [Caenimonas sedimenti]|uniref:Uncharacterized protein n=1 Tax=Caenimonas sedimenti TaxID=2596921 RepID=A0A562ZKL1_9BURK|nr:hypothetical protein [Caenimonas sedimenti]TWO69122.1 hypothetical protein FN976_20520 [Caenimonas sedimenti]
MNTAPSTPATSEHWACEFDRLRHEMRSCTRRLRRRPSSMVGIEVAYLALSDWLAAGGHHAGAGASGNSAVSAPTASSELVKLGTPPSQ